MDKKWIKILAILQTKRKRPMRFLTFLLIVFLIFSLFLSSCLEEKGLDDPLSEAISGYEFSLASFQVALLRDLFKKTETLEVIRAQEVEIVLNYFNGGNQEKMAAESIIARQIEEVLAEEGFFIFPRIRFVIVSLPGYLIISPKEEIRREEERHMVPELSETKKEEIESRVSDLGVSAYIADLGGTPTFPIVVYKNASLKKTIEIAVHEWVHQYLFFRPLGFRYALHFLGWPNDDIATINEAAADIVEAEIAQSVYSRYYSSFEDQKTETSSAPAFDFRSNMRRIRNDVDDLLRLGKIEEAESYMEEQRLYINSYGYNIRKLNQAYFAFHGTYPSISVNPLTERVKDIREKSDSLKDFLDEIGKIRKAQELLENIQ